MSVNSSSDHYSCVDIEAVVFMSIAFNITKILLILPLNILILYLGYQQWRQSSSAPTRHSDVFTFYAAAMELLYVFGTLIAFCGIYTDLSELTEVGFCASSITVTGQIGFHILTCVERYLAVVHPVIYLSLRRERGVRIRNISIVCVWLLSFGWTGLTVQSLPDLPIIPYLCFLVFSLIVITFCSLCVLCVLIRPVGGERKRVDPSKQRAFHTINAIMAVLWVWFSVFLTCLALDQSDLLDYSVECLVKTSGFWFSLPSCLVLPMLFLQSRKTAVMLLKQRAKTTTGRD